MPPTPATCRFGDFLFDPASGELKGAIGVTRLQPQVAALLAVLIERAGDVVTRAELQARLWPDTTVEFDDGLNFCIRQLRIALGDDANAPTYIETLPKRGYRFLPAMHKEAVGIRAPRKTRRMGFAAVVVAIVAAACLLWLGNRATPPRIALRVLPFAADTTDSMMTAYRARLFYQLTDEARAVKSWRLLDSAGGAPTHVLSGSLTRDGNSVRLFVQLVDAADQKKLWADDIVDAYAFSGNSKMTADRIEKAVAQLLAPR